MTIENNNKGSSIAGTLFNSRQGLFNGTPIFNMRRDIDTVSGAA